MATITRFFFNFNERHPEKKQSTSIDYNMATVMMPLNLIGSLVGAYIFQTFPELYIMIILTLLLCLLTFESVKKYRQIRAKEVKLEKEAQL